MWNVDNSFQLISFLIIFSLGAVLGLVYDFLRALRKVKSFNTLEVFFQDIIYFLIISPVVFCYELSLTGGEIRAFVFIALILGFLIYRFTASRIIFKILLIFFKAYFWFFIRTKSLFYKIFDWIFLILNKIYDFFSSFFEKTRIYGKKVLKMK